jgi:prevent-host-death family protein
MTTQDYHETMERVGIADLKAHLSEHLRTVRSGRALTVVDRGTPVAKLVPFSPGPERLTIRPPRESGALAEVPLPPPMHPRRGMPDVVDLLLRERQTDR